MGIFGGSPQDQVDLDHLTDRITTLEAAVASLQGQVAALTGGAVAAGGPVPYAGNPSTVTDGALPAGGEWLAEVRRLKESGRADRRHQAVPREHRPRPQGGQGRGRGPGLGPALLLPMKVAQGVADGSVRLAYRRWRKQDVQPGQVFTTSAGMVRVDSVTVVSADEITDEDARLAGWPDAERLRRRLAPEGETYRVELAWAGPDPRVALRSSDDAHRGGRRGAGPTAGAAGPGLVPRRVDAALPRADP